MADAAESLDLPATYCWAAQPGPQTEAITADWCPQILFGGAAGGGKSDFLLGDYLQDVPRYGRAWQGILFRRSYKELEELVSRSHEIYPQSGGTFNVGNSWWSWGNGAILKLRHLDRDADANNYQGHQFTWIGWDELGHWPSAYPYRYLRARLRSAHPVPTKRIRATANPGGVGHQWIKAYFVDPAPRGFEPLFDPETGMDRMFIPSRLRDNKILVANDPGYEGRLKGLGSPDLVRAWLEGDWNVILGAYFPEFKIDRHVIAPRELPKSWTRFRAMDWGSFRPSAVLWFAVSDGTLPEFPANALICYRELYTATEPNVGMKLTAEEMADRIADAERGDKIAYGTLDPAAWKEDGGPSIAERMANRKVSFVPSDNSRIIGWDQVRSRLKGEDRPMLYFFSTCTNIIRTLPALQHDENKPEDVDSDGEDHAGDALRYACMSRPYQPPAPKAPVKSDVYYYANETGGIRSNLTWREMMKRRERRREA